LRNNPDLSEDFRNTGGRFTTYATFCEACADGGPFTTPLYHARERIAGLRDVVGIEYEGLIAGAREGHKQAYEKSLHTYDALTNKAGAFVDLVRPFW